MRAQACCLFIMFRIVRGSRAVRHRFLAKPSLIPSTYTSPWRFFPAHLTIRPAFFKGDRAGNMKLRSDLLECRIQIGNLIVDVLDPHRNSNHVARNPHEAADIFRH